MKGSKTLKTSAYLVLLLLGGCILTDRRLQPPPIEDDPAIKPTHWETSRYIEREKLRNEASSKKEMKFLSVQGSCSEGRTGTQLTLGYQDCKFINTISFQVYCKSRTTGVSRPLPFKKVSFLIRYELPDGEKREIPYKSMTGSQGEWSVKFNTASEIDSVTVSSMGKREVLGRLSEPIIYLDDEECLGL
jgi:hypothetical protein